VPELGEPGDFLAFDYDEIEEYRVYKAEQDQKDCGGPSYTVNEVRERRGDDPIDGGDTLRQGAIQPSSKAPGSDPDVTEEPLDNGK
jgi:hypothetical protein